MIGVWPMVAMNIVLAAINPGSSCSCSASATTRRSSVLQVGIDDEYLHHVLTGHAEDIARSSRTSPGTRTRRTSRSSWCAATRRSAWWWCTATARWPAWHWTTSPQVPRLHPGRVRVAAQRPVREPRLHAGRHLTEHGRRLLRPGRLPPRRLGLRPGSVMVVRVETSAGRAETSDHRRGANSRFGRRNSRFDAPGRGRRDPAVQGRPGCPGSPPTPAHGPAPRPGLRTALRRDRRARQRGAGVEQHSVAHRPRPRPAAGVRRRRRGPRSPPRRSCVVPRGTPSAARSTVVLVTSPACTRQSREVVVVGQLVEAVVTSEHPGVDPGRRTRRP